MTDERSIERVLDQWFATGPTELPDRVIHAVATDIERVDQRPRWRLLEGRHAMSPTVRIAAALAAVLVFATAVFTLLAGSSRPSPNPTPSTSPLPSSSLETSACGDRRPACRLLAPGRLTSSLFSPAITVPVPAGWMNTLDVANEFSLVPDTQANRDDLAAGYGAVTSIEIVRDLANMSPDCSGAEHTQTAAEMVNEIANQPWFTTSNVTAVTLGGLSGASIDVQLVPGWSETCDSLGRTPEAALLAAPAGTAGSHVNLTVQPSDRYELTILDLPAGGNVVIIVRTSQADLWTSFRAQARPIVNSLIFRPAG